MDSGKMICDGCGKEILDGESFEELEDETIVCKECHERKCKKCEECGELFLADNMTVYKDDYYCENCVEEHFEECGLCGQLTHEDDLEFFGDDIRICPDCFAAEFPEVDEAANEEETTPAYEAMKERLIGLRVEDMANETYEYDSGMDDDGYRYSFTVDIDAHGRICDISRLSKERCQAVWTTGESWHVCEIDPDDYDEDGFVEDTIRTLLDIVDEDDIDEEDTETEE